MELIDRYIYAVTKRLPQKQREDIDKELRTLIEDMLNERCNGNPTDSNIEEVLKELGEPSKLAAKYRDDKSYLIGPESYYNYLFVLKLVVAISAFGSCIGGIFGIIDNPPASAWSAFGNIIASIFEGAVAGFTWVTVIFAIYDKINKEKEKPSDWKLSDLSPIPKRKEIIRPAGPIIGILFAVLFIIIFNYADKYIGAYIGNGNLHIIPIFSHDGLRQVMPLLITVFCFSIAKETIKLIFGKWNLTVGISIAALSILGLILCVIIFKNPIIWNQNFVSEMNDAGMKMTETDMNTVWKNVTNSFIYIIAFGSIIESIEALVKGIKYSR